MPPGSMQGFTPRLPGSTPNAAAPPGYQQDYRTMSLPGSQPLSMPPSSMPLGSMPFGGSTPPRTMIPPQSQGPFPPQSQGLPYEARAQDISKRMNAGIDRHRGLTRDLDQLT